MKIITVPDCSTCPYVGHTGNIGGNAKPRCDHEEAIRLRLGAEGGLSRLTLTNKYPKQPKWCPLMDGPPITNALEEDK